MQLSNSDVNFAHALPAWRRHEVVLSHELNQQFADFVFHSFNFGCQLKDSLGSFPVSVLVVLEPIIESVIERLKSVTLRITLTCEKGFLI